MKWNKHSQQAKPSISPLFTSKHEPQLWGITQDLILKCFICRQLGSGLDSTASIKTILWFPATLFLLPYPLTQPFRILTAFIKTISFILMKVFQPVSRRYRTGLTTIAFFPSEYHESCISLWCKVSDYINLSKLCWNEGHSVCYNQ